MCGILFEICYKASGLITDNLVHNMIRNRGPNCMQTLVISSIPGVTVTFCGAVLWMQGAKLVPQPVENDRGVLLYNGDIFDETWDSNTSDTQVIMEKLSQRNDSSTETHIIETLKSLKGPFSLIYFDKHTKTVFFARDKIGRSTMLIYKSEDLVVISSVLGRNYQCLEIPATHLYCMNIENQKLKLYSWSNSDPETETPLNDWLSKLQIEQGLPDDKFKLNFDENIELTDDDNIISFIENTAVNSACKITILENLLHNNLLENIVNKVKKLLEKSVKIRLKRQPNQCKNCLMDENVNCGHCTVGILFSGGLDCTVLAVLADKYLAPDQSIDLINVAFSKDNSYEVPDRVTGRQSYEELKVLCATRKWNFKEVNVTRSELEKFQESVIADLVYPRQTILDESLGSALWFAARGQDDHETSPCRVLLLGSGADELFGGYTRHRNAYKRRGWSGLAMELLLDWKRISFRNLSRDNRVICDHGRQPRMPYLDEAFTEYVLQLKPWFKCFPSEHMGQGVGDKLLLRLVAYRLGLRNAVVLPKRALQFGSRIANKKEKGADISQRFVR